jgi:hypothetical protein
MNVADNLAGTGTVGGQLAVDGSHPAGGGRIGVSFIAVPGRM